MALPGSNQDGISRERHSALLPGGGGVSAVPETETVDTSDEKYLFDKGYFCPVCDSSFTSLTVLSGKAGTESTDIDLRVRFRNVDLNKYRIVQCTRCGYTAMDSDFYRLMPREAKALHGQLMATERKGIVETYSVRSYEDAFRLYRATLRCSMIKGGKKSERAGIALFTAFLLRAWREHFVEHGNARMIPESASKASENKYLSFALEYFTEARQSEDFPILNMNESTLDYLIAALQFETGKDKDAMRYLSNVLRTRSSNSGIRRMAEDLRDLIRANQEKAQQ